MPLGLKSRKIIFVHGIFGWGENELPFSYWGDALAQFRPRFEPHEVKCGPVSSFHDRACELFAQIKGGDFIYAKAPDGAKRSVVPRGERKHVAGPLLPDWSADNAVILVGHSAGAHTCLALQRLLRDDFFGVGSNADWVEAVICISGVLNGSTLTYLFGCNPVTGVLSGDPKRLTQAAVEIASLEPRLPLDRIDPWLEQWNGHHEDFVKGKDNLAYDLTLVGCQAANAAFSTNPSTYYLSLVTSMPPGLPNLPGLPIRQLADGINVLLEGSAIYQAAVVNFAPPLLPLANWDTVPDLRIEAWRENDGAVSEISQHLPFTHHSEPLGAGRFSDNPPMQKGKWYFQSVKDFIGTRFDHLDPAFGAILKEGVGPAQRELYQKLAALL